MGCSEAKNIPSLICLFEPQNENQKSYCLKLREQLHPSRDIRYEIRSRLNATFQIQFTVNGQTHTLENRYDESQMESTVSEIYKLLGETTENEPKN